MNWYKYSQKIENFQDRNYINEKIRSLESIAEVVGYAGQLVYQTARGAKGVIEQISSHKKMSSYDDLLMLLKQAEDIALDNPLRFEMICHQVSDKLMRKAKSLKIERRKFVEDLPKKGLVD